MRLVGECIECGAKKSKFIKATDKQGGTLGDALFEAGVKTVDKATKRVQVIF